MHVQLMSILAHRLALGLAAAAGSHRTLAGRAHRRRAHHAAHLHRGARAHRGLDNSSNCSRGNRRSSCCAAVSVKAHSVWHCPRADTAFSSSTKRRAVDVATRTATSTAVHTASLRCAIGCTTHNRHTATATKKLCAAVSVFVHRLALSLAAAAGSHSTLARRAHRRRAHHAAHLHRGARAHRGFDFTLGNGICTIEQNRTRHHQAHSRGWPVDSSTEAGFRCTCDIRN